MFTRGACLLGVLMCFCGAPLAGDTIGLYFDTEFTQNCISEVSSYPFATTAFLVIRDPSAVEGIGGWEGEISLDQGIHITGCDLGDGAINFYSCPIFAVGFGQPVTVNPIIVLARLDLFVTSPGDIYLHAPENVSIPGAIAPIYADSNGELTAMSYDFGSPVNPVASIGLPDCPTHIDDQVLYNFVEPEFVYVPVDTDETYSSQTVIYAAGEVTGADSKVGVLPKYLDRNESAYLGRVVSRQEFCWDDDGFTRGVLRVEMDVAERLWGPDFENHVFWVRHYSVPGCVSYGKSGAFVDGFDLNVGDDAYVFSHYRNGVFWAKVSGVYPPNKKYGNFTDLAREAADRKSTLKKSKNASLVALVTPTQGSEFGYDVRVVYKGSRSIEKTTIFVKDRRLIAMSGKFPRDNKRLLLFLKTNAAGEYETLDRSGDNMYFVLEDGIYNHNGLFVSSRMFSNIGELGLGGGAGQ